MYLHECRVWDCAIDSRWCLRAGPVETQGSVCAAIQAMLECTYAGTTILLASNGAMIRERYIDRASCRPERKTLPSCAVGAPGGTAAILSAWRHFGAVSLSPTLHSALDDNRSAAQLCKSTTRGIDGFRRERACACRIAAKDRI